jgi:N6-adenosine-specific RNA methylase IME4
VTGKDGKSYPATKPRKQSVHTNDADKALSLLEDAPEAVSECCARWNITEQWKLEDLIERFKRAKNDLDPELCTFWTIYHSGYIQSGEEADACYYPTATRAEIKKADKANADYRKSLARDAKRERREKLPQSIYNVIYADPAWEYSNTGVHGAAAPHYDTMPTEDICALLRQIELQIDDNAVLFMWVTNSHIPDALQVIEAWGFNYKTNMVWVKTELEKPGSGWYVRGRHELLFIATRGSFIPLDLNIAPPIGSVITAPVQEHSRKPDEVYDVIERLYPGCHYVELFARRKREGWDAFGDEVNNGAE